MKFSRYNVDCNSFITSTMETERFELLTPCLARQVLSQLSYAPIWVTYLIIQAIRLVGLRRLELPTSRLSGVRSNRLSYKPINLAATYFPIPLPV